MGRTWCFNRHEQRSRYNIIEAALRQLNSLMVLLLARHTLREALLCALVAANQFLIPMAIALGAPVTAKEFVAFNLIPGES